MTKTDVAYARAVDDAIARLEEEERRWSADEAHAELELLARADLRANPEHGRTFEQRYTEHLARRGDLARRLFPVGG
jgi:hypothetical protein